MKGVGARIRPIVALGLVWLLASVPAWVLAQDEATADWEQTGLSGPVLQLFTPTASSGTLFARTPDALLQSDDDGMTWNPISMPPASSTAVVDPTDPSVLYADGTGGLYKSSDGGSSWSLILSGVGRFRIAVSPADQNVVYVAHMPARVEFRFLRSRDGGATWATLEETRGTLCEFEVRLLQAHPTDVSRVFRTAGCYAGRTSDGALLESRDHGATWSELVRPRGQFPVRIAGGQSVAPARFYLTANGGYSISTSRGSTLFRSDDDGSTWTPMLAVQPAGAGEQPGIARIGGLAIDAALPDQVYVGLSGAQTGVKASSDAGLTWVDFGANGPLGNVADLALRGDGTLYAATDEGLWRWTVKAEADGV